MSKNMFDDLASTSPNRERFMMTLNTATELMGGGGSPSEATSETDILNFALNLEYLEAEFYTYAVEVSPSPVSGIGVDGKANGENPASGDMTIGGSKVNFDNDEIFSRDIAAEIGVDERAHVILLRNALGSPAVAESNINLNAVGIGFGNQVDFRIVARILEDIGVTAYTGAAGMLKTPAIITTAARILAAEAAHCGSVRTQVTRLKIPSSTVDGADLIPPPSGKTTQYLSINPSNGLAATTTAEQVLYLAFGMAANAKQGGFFPTGLNGKFTMSGGPATGPSLA